MKFPVRHLSLILTASLAACTAGPDFVPPKLAPADHYTSPAERVEPQPERVLGKQIESEWKTVFSYPPLSALIHRALEDNYDLTAARETLAQAEEAVKAQQGSLMPQGSMNALAGRQKYGVALFGPSNFVIPPFSYYEVGPFLSWSPDFFGGGKRSVERQQALATYQHRQLDALYVELTANVVAQSVQIAAMQAEITTVQHLLKADERMLSLIQSSYDSGMATQADILNARNRLAADRALLPPLKQQYSSNLHTLSVLVGKAPADWQPPTLVFDDLKIPASLPVALPSELLRKRPDILAAEASLQVASASLGVATANQYPALTLTANMLQEALTPSNLFLGAGNAWALAGGVSMPLFNGGMLEAEKQGAFHAYQASLAEYHQTVVQAFSQVADALTALANDTDAVKAMQSVVDTSQSALDLSMKSRAAGNTADLEVEAAHRALAQTQLKLEEALTQQYLDTTRLFVALGGSPLSNKTQ
ncbi:efflux transporter outer membrane subunit [Ferrovum sp.]|uniref:efflux transporter outer membrane subunit n=1 Tax=Ferrovum sp. TaxID=2609467 RepID=UPI00261B758D|nr:efflux transporter outer membrane subunit [Ferrovum sp.]